MPTAFRSRPRYLSPAIAVAVFTLACPDRAFATAFFINQQSVRGLGRVDAGNTVAADELGTIFFNPAGLTKVVQDGKDPDCIRVALGVHLIIPRSRQHDRGSFATTPGTLGMSVPVGGGDARNPTDPTPVPDSRPGPTPVSTESAAPESRPTDDVVQQPVQQNTNRQIVKEMLFELSGCEADGTTVWCHFTLENRAPTDRQVQARRGRLGIAPRAIRR